jgi:hypothetical protein
MPSAKKRSITVSPPTTSAIGKSPTSHMTRAAQEAEIRALMVKIDKDLLELERQADRLPPTRT